MHLVLVLLIVVVMEGLGLALIVAREGSTQATQRVAVSLFVLTVAGLELDVFRVQGIILRGNLLLVGTCLALLLLDPRSCATIGRGSSDDLLGDFALRGDPTGLLLDGTLGTGANCMLGAHLGCHHHSGHGLLLLMNLLWLRHLQVVISLHPT